MIKKSYYIIPYILLISLIYLLCNATCTDTIKDIYLIDKTVKTTHTKDKTYCTYHMSFYYVDKNDVIYHHKVQPLDIWKQVYYRKNNSIVSLKFGVDTGAVFVSIIISGLLIFLGLMYTKEIL